VGIQQGRFKITGSSPHQCLREYSHFIMVMGIKIFNTEGQRGALSLFYGEGIPQIYFPDCLDNLACRCWIERVEVGLRLPGDVVISSGAMPARCFAPPEKRLRSA